MGSGNRTYFKRNDIPGTRKCSAEATGSRRSGEAGEQQRQGYGGCGVRGQNH